MTSAIIFAFAWPFPGRRGRSGAAGLADRRAAVGGRDQRPLLPLLFLLLSPLILQGEPVVWRGLPIFIAIGLFFPASLTLLTFASNRRSGL